MIEQKYGEISTSLTDMLDLISGYFLPNPPSFKSDKFNYEEGIDVYDSIDDGTNYTSIKCKIDFINDSYQLYIEMESEFDDYVNIDCSSNSFDKFIELLKENKKISHIVTRYF